MRRNAHMALPPLDSQMIVRLPASLRIELDAQAAANHLRLSDVVRAACREYLRRNGRRKPAYPATSVMIA